MDSTVEKTGRIFNIQKYSIYDGDGIRTLVFFKGCNIRCDWCANPEGIERGYQVMFSKSKCEDCGMCAQVCPVGIHKMVQNASGEFEHQVDRTISCIGCRKCEETCINEALDIMGKEVSVSELMEVIMQDYDFYMSSNGGVTLSGGECTLQADFAADLLAECKRQMINTAIETNGTTDVTNYEKLAPVVDLFLFDIKHINTHQHKDLFGIGNEGVRRNIERLVDLNANIVIRMPLIRGYNDSYDHITGTINYVMELAKKPTGNIRRIDFLPYHQLGKSKYDSLDMIYPVKDDPSFTPEELNKLEKYFETFDFDVKLVRH